MGFYEYAIKAGSSAAVLDNIEDTFQSVLQTPRHYPPVSDLVAQGSGLVVTMDNQAYFRGVAVIQWRWDVLPYTAFAYLLNTYLGGFTVSSASVSIRTRNEQNSYANYNAVMLRPMPKEDYTRGRHGLIIDLAITFRNPVAY